MSSRIIHHDSCVWVGYDTAKKKRSYTIRTTNKTSLAICELAWPTGSFNWQLVMHLYFTINNKWKTTKQPLQFFTYVLLLVFVFLKISRADYRTKKHQGLYSPFSVAVSVTFSFSAIFYKQSEKSTLLKQR